jgi:hypothetical protein
MMSESFPSSEIFPTRRQVFMEASNFVRHYTSQRLTLLPIYVSINGILVGITYAAASLTSFPLAFVFASLLGGVFSLVLLLVFHAITANVVFFQRAAGTAQETLGAVSFWTDKRDVSVRLFDAAFVLVTLIWLVVFIVSVVSLLSHRSH